jgi:hypothetical protein
MRILFSCLLFASLASAAGKVTFTETIAPIVYRNCVTCHRPGEAAPFALITLDDVRKRGALIASVTESRYMPPWHAEHGYGDFAGERRLTDAEIAAIGEWVKQGMPEGDRTKLPKLPQFTSGWQLGKPDLILEMPAGYDVPASGPDIYRSFALPTGLLEDKYIRAVEFRPSTRKVVHHSLFAYTPAGSMKEVDGKDGKPGFTGMNGVGVGVGLQPGNGSLGGWAVGATPAFLAENEATLLPKGSDFLLQMHFHPTGKAETERSSIGLYFAEKAPERKLLGVTLPAVFGIGAGLNIAAGETGYTIRDSAVLAADVRALGVSAHAHYLGKEFKATATLPDGSTQPLLWIRNWDFNWQEQYMYRQPLMLPKGTRVDVAITYDNSASNPRNPSNPPQRVMWGEQSLDEMGGVGLMVVAVNKEDEAAFSASEGARQIAAVRKGGADGTVKRYLDAEARSRAVASARLQDITIFDRQGKVIRTVGEPGIYSHAAFSPEGARMAVIKSDRTTGSPNVWVIDMKSGQGTQITSGRAGDTSPVWSPDGKQIAYSTSIADGNYSQISIRNADGTGPSRVLYKHKPGNGVWITDWAADGTITFWTGENSIYLLSQDGSAKQIAQGRGGRFSPDGTQIAFANLESGRMEIFTMPVAGGAPTRMTTTGALGAIVWRADGKGLTALSFQGQILTAYDFSGASMPEALFKVPPIVGQAQLSGIASKNGEQFVFLQQQPLAASAK